MTEISAVPEVCVHSNKCTSDELPNKVNDTESTTEGTPEFTATFSSNVPVAVVVPRLTIVTRTSWATFAKVCTPPITAEAEIISTLSTETSTERPDVSEGEFSISEIAK